MEEGSVLLTLDQAQRAVFLAQVLASLFSLTQRPSEARHQARIQRLQEISGRLFHWCLEEEDRPLLLSPREAQTLRCALILLQPLYEQWEETEARRVALAHLSTCLALVQEAEQQAAGRERLAEAITIQEQEYAGEQLPPRPLHPGRRLVASLLQGIWSAPKKRSTERESE